MVLSMPLTYLNRELYCSSSDSELSKAAQAGDLEAFNRIVLKYQDVLYRVALRILADEDSAYDAVQNGFISAYQHIDSFRGGSLKSWLIRIVVNKCGDLLRSARAHQTFSLDTFLPNGWENDDDPGLEIADPGISVESQAEQSDLDRVVQVSLKALPYHYRAVLVLADIEEFPYEEISSILRLPMGTVKSRLARARLQMRSLLLRQGILLPETYKARP